MIVPGRGNHTDSVALNNDVPLTMTSDLCPEQSYVMLLQLLRK